VKPNGIVDVSALEKAITDDTVLVSGIYANNEIGTIQPIAAIGKLIAKIRLDRVSRGVSQPLYFHTDACQAAGALDLHVSRLGVDLMSLNGSKIGGPKQSGILYVKAGTKLEPLMYGGGQERGLRSGTENVPGIIGFAKALELAQSKRDAESKRLSGLRDQLWQDIQKAIPDAELNGDHGYRLPNNLNVMIPGIDGETAVLYFDNEGIVLSTGSACTTGGTEPSHVLKAIGRSDEEATSSLRITIGAGTTETELGKLVKVLPTIVKRLRQLKRGTV
jgi:cysteine desulfurase